MSNCARIVISRKNDVKELVGFGSADSGRTTVDQS